MEARGSVIGWALRQAAAWAAIALAVCLVVAYRDRLLPPETRPSPVSAPAAPSHQPVENTLAYPADAKGHVELDADVDGAIVHFVVDTGATLVTLTPRDAEAAGIGPGGLSYTLAMNTANGRIKAAPVMLREVRLGQLSLADVQGVVVPNLSISLLGMSFLSRLDRWQMQGGALTIWY